MGANKKQPSPKHLASACKARLLQRFAALCASLSPRRLLPADAPARLRGDAGEPGERRLGGLSYAELKQLSEQYQRRKGEWLAGGPFRDWVTAPASCEAFTCMCISRGQ